MASTAWRSRRCSALNCRHLPGCSDYAGEAIETNGAWKGSWLALARICRCHPWGSHGHRPGARSERRAPPFRALALWAMACQVILDTAGSRWRGKPLPISIARSAASPTAMSQHADRRAPVCISAMPAYDACNAILNGRPTEGFSRWESLDRHRLCSRRLSHLIAPIETTRRVAHDASRNFSGLAARPLADKIGRALGVSRQAVWERFS